MRSTCVPCNLSHVELNKLTNKVLGKGFWATYFWVPQRALQILTWAACWTGLLKEAQHGSSGDGVTLKPNLAPPQPPPHPPTPMGRALWTSQQHTSTASRGAMKGPFHLPCSFLLESCGLVLALCFFMLWLNIVYLLNWYLRPKGSHFAHT